MKAKKIRIKSLEQGLKAFETAYTQASQSKKMKKKEGTFFASVGAARKVLTESRIQLLKTIKDKKPASIYELAKLTHRDFKNVSQDVSFLAEMELVELQKPHGARRQRRPVLVSDHISMELSI